MKENMKTIPAMDMILSQDWVCSWIARLGRAYVKDIISRNLQILRSRLKDNDSEIFSWEEFRRTCIKSFTHSGLKRVINATGVVIHTNLGRSLLPEEAINAAETSAKYYTAIEYDTENGTRAGRNIHVEGLICSLTGAESALAVNNNAGAVMLCLYAFAHGREVIVSRGELVEIGGAFRLPDIMSLSGAKLSEVGTTNRTYLKDYEAAITPDTSMIMKVHRSNFRITGFTHEPERKELAELAHSHNIIFMDDAGSGYAAGNFPGEPEIRQCIHDGADIVTFSGDKIFGGPQSGIIAGRRDLIDRLKHHPMNRALRPGKMTIAALEATLRLYLNGEYGRIPTIRMLSTDTDTLRHKAEELAREISRLIRAEVHVIETDDASGGGSCPGEMLKGWGVFVRGNIQAELRSMDIPVICTAKDGGVIFHVRTLQEGEAKIIAESVAKIFSE